ncbi:hypothetical protein HK101_004353 [Irineochytrium annulatum]|nr:hypothetical protein HK101_004353 [Irineochytrium annulatum]
MTLNPALDCTLLQLGEQVCVASASLNANTNAAPAQVPCGKAYTLVAGDSCASVASMYGVDQAYLTNYLNFGVDCAKVGAGATLCVRPRSMTPCARTHAVQAGEGCDSVEAGFSMAAGSLLSLNPGLNCASLTVGEQLCVTAVTPTKVSHKRKISGYWGQNAANAPVSAPLYSYCATDLYDTINLSFLAVFYVHTSTPTYVLNFADQGYWTSADPENRNGQNFGMAAIAADIVSCQNLGVKITLSIGGGVIAYNITQGDGPIFASAWHAAFFGGRATTVARPFGNVVLDGIDFDIEATVDQNELIKLAAGLRGLNPGMIISSAPQCSLMLGADANLGTFLQRTDLYDYINVQFYNNPACELTAPGFLQNFDTWVKMYNKPVVLGIPSSPTASNTGFVKSVVTMKSIVDVLVSKYTIAQFNSITFWDVSTAAIQSENTTGMSADLTYDLGIRHLLDSYP